MKKTQTTPKRKRKIIALTPELYEELKQAKIAYAAKHRQDITLQAFVEIALRAGFEQVQ